MKKVKSDLAATLPLKNQTINKEYMLTHSDNIQLDIFLPIKTVTESNGSEHWTKKRKRAKLQHLFVRSMLNSFDSRLIVKLPCRVILTRIGVRSLDGDNLVSSFKYVRDAIADYIHPGLEIGQADSDPNITWEYVQVKKDKKDKVGVRILII